MPDGMEGPPPPPGAPFPATVAKILDPHRIVLNRGARDGVKLGQRFLVYRVSEEQLIDPETNEWLGVLEIPKGTGRVISLQERMCIIESDSRTAPQRRRITKSTSPYATLFGRETVEEEEVPRALLPFDDPGVGDKAKPI